METEFRNGNAATLQKLLDDVKIVLQDGQELLKFGASRLRERASAGARVTNRSVHDHPYPSIAIVFGVGLVLGLLGHSLITSTSGRWQEED